MKKLRTVICLGLIFIAWDIHAQMQLNLQVIRHAFSREKINNAIPFDERRMYNDILTYLKNCRDIDDRRELVRIVVDGITSFSIPVLEESDKTRRIKISIIDNRSILFSNLIGSLSELEESAELHLILAEHIGECQLLGQRKEKDVSNYWRAYNSSIKQYRFLMLCACAHHFGRLRVTMEEANFKEFVKKFADTAKMTNEERLGVTRRFPELQLRW